MTKTDLYKDVAENSELTTKEAKRAVEIVLERLQENLVKGEIITITNFATLRPYHREGGATKKVPNVDKDVESKSKNKVQIKFAPNFDKRLQDVTIKRERT